MAIVLHARPVPVSRHHEPALETADQNGRLFSQPSEANRQKAQDEQTKVDQARAILEMLLGASSGIIPIKETRFVIRKG